MRQVSIGRAHRYVEVNVLLDMLLHWWGSKGRTLERRGLRAVVWEEEIEMCVRSDRCKIQDGRGRGSNN